MEENSKIESSHPLEEEVNFGNIGEDPKIESSYPLGEDEEQPRRSTPTYPNAEPQHVMEKVLDNWRRIGLKFSAADEEFLESSRKKFGREDWQWKEEASEAPHSLKPAAAVQRQKRFETYRLRVEELKRRAMVLKRRSDFLHLVLSYPMKPETSKQSQPCLGSYFSDINQNIKDLEKEMFDGSSYGWNEYYSIDTIRFLLNEVEEQLGMFDFDIAPYLEKQPPKAKASADVEEGSGSTSTEHHVAYNLLMPATIDEQFENTPPPASPVMHKMAIDFAVRQILEYFESRSSGKIGISGRGWEQVLEALKDMPSVTRIFDFVHNVSLDRHQSMLKLQVNVLRQVYTKSNEGSARFLLLVDSIDQEIDLAYRNNIDVCIVFQSEPQRANYEPLEVDLEIRMEDHLLPWNLFWKKASRLLLSTITLRRKVEHFIKESHGHLLAILLLTRALQDETDPIMWETTAQDQLDAVMINVLRFIWDRLDMTTKNCIKYFVTHKKEEKEFTKASLIDLWISSGWIEKRYEGSLVLKKLFDYFFLEDVGRDCFRMREEIKLGLLNIFAPSLHLHYLEKRGLGLTKSPEPEEWNAFEIHLMENKISELPESPNCTTLVKLYLQCNYDLMVIPSSFFSCMPFLHILDLSFTSIKSLPESISKLVTLQKFFLRGCDLLTKLPPEIGALKRLKEFDLEGTYLLYLPKEIGELVKLTHLKVCLSGSANLYKKHNGVDTIIPRNALSNLHQLKKLSIDVVPDGDWQDVEVRAIINEVCRLNHLEELKLYLPMAEELKEVRLYRVLKKFRFIIGCSEQCFISHLPHEVEEEFNNLDKLSKGLKYINGEGEPTKEITNVLEDADAFSLERHWTVKNLSEFGHTNMKKLKFCCLVECNELQTIIDIEDDEDDLDIDGNDEDDWDCDYKYVFDELKYLSIHCMKSMQSLCKVPAEKGLVIMPQLNSLALHTCPSLNTIFTLAMLRNLVNLKELIVEDCPNVNSLVTLEDSTVNLGHFLPKLKKISLLFLPELVSISSGMCIAPTLEMLIIFHCPKLQMLSSTEVSSKDLNVIKAEREWWTALRWHESDGSSGRQSYLANKFIPLDMIGDFKDDDEEQPWRLTACDSDFHMEQSRSETRTFNERWNLMTNILSNWREAGRKLSAADGEFLRRILKERKCNAESTIRRWLLKTESGKAPANPLKRAASEAKKERSEKPGWVAVFKILKAEAAARMERLEEPGQKARKERLEKGISAAAAPEWRLKAEELRRKAMVLKSRSNLLNLILSYPMKPEAPKRWQPCLGGYFSTISQTIKQFENLIFDESSSAAPEEGDDIINTIEELFEKVEKNLARFDFEIAPYLEKQPLKAAAASDVEKGSGSTNTKHVNVIVDYSTMPAIIVEQSENAPPPSPVMHKLAIDFAVRQIVEFFEGRGSRKIAISGSSCWNVLKALEDVPSITSMFHVIPNLSFGRHQSMIELHLKVLEQIKRPSWTESGKKFNRFLLLVYSDDQGMELDYLNFRHSLKDFRGDICIVLATQPQRASELLEVDLEIRMEDHLLPWNLFCKKASRVLLSTTTLQQKVEHFIKESHGHLLAILLLTRALQDETTPIMWEFALCDQQPAGTNVQDQLDAVMINVLRLIWERLDVTTKNCIKYFIAHKKEEEKEISKDSLIDLWISSGWIEKSKEGLLVFKILIDYFLLEDAGRGNFRMREEIKFGLLNTFAPGQRLQYLEKGGLRPRVPPEAEQWNAKEIHLINNEISELPESPNCSVLVNLYLQCNYDLMVIPSSFFNCMPVLHVLDLSFTSIKFLPESISRLVPLQKFFLRGCDLLTKLPPEIGALKKLKEFDLEGTYLLYLPKEIGELVKLTHLKLCLSGSANLYKEQNGVDTIIPRNALSNLHQLKELSIDVVPDGDWWDVEVRAIINEVCSLNHLKELKLYLPMVEELKEVRLYRALKKFRLIIGCRQQCFISHQPQEVEEEFNNLDKFSKGLKYINGEGEPTEEITNVLEGANAFSLERHWTVKNLSEFGHTNMEKLEFCCLVDCNEIQTIIDIEDGEDDIDDNDEDNWDCDYENVLDKLKYLSVHYMKSMQSLCKVPAKKGLVIMPQLNFLALHTCPSLNTIFTPAMLENLINLKELMVEDCPNVNSLVSPECLALASGDFLPSLKKISLLNLPKLGNIYGGLCIARKLESMIIFYCPKLEMLSITEVSCEHLKVVKGDSEWWNALNLTPDQRKVIQIDNDACGLYGYVETLD